MNSDNIHRKKTVQIIYKDDLIKVTIPEKLKVSVLLTYLRSLLNVPKERLLLLFYRNEKISEDQTIDETVYKNFKEPLILLDEENYIYSPPEVFKSPLEKKGKLKILNSMPENNEKKEVMKMDELIMQVTGADKKLTKEVHRSGNNDSLIRQILRNSQRMSYLEQNEFAQFLLNNNQELRVQLPEMNYGSELEDYIGDMSSYTESSLPSASVSRQHSLRPVNNNNSNLPNQSEVAPNNVNSRSNLSVFAMPIRRRMINYNQARLTQLLEMGFSEHDGRIALRLSRNDLDYASNLLLYAPPEVLLDNEDLAGENLPEADQGSNANIINNAGSNSNPNQHELNQGQSEQISNQPVANQVNIQIINNQGQSEVNLRDGNIDMPGREILLSMLASFLQDSELLPFSQSELSEDQDN